MITIKIRDWAVIGGVRHVATTYQVATTNTFTNIVDNHPNDSKNLTVYYSPVIVPVNNTYYIRVMRHFSNGTNSGWGNTIPVNNVHANAGVIAYDPVQVYQPVVNVDLVGLTDPYATSYTITTSAFVGLNEGHGYTVWIVLNDKDEVIEYIKSTTALTGIVMPKTYSKYLNTKYVKILAIHGTLTNIESSPGEIIKDLNNVNFSLTTSSDMHSPGIDLTVNIVRVVNAPNTVVSRIALRDLNGNELWSHIVPTATTASMVVPGTLFVEDTQYLVTAYGVPGDDLHSTSIPVQVRPNAVLDKLDLSYVYSKVLVAGTAATRFPTGTTFVTQEIYNSRILLAHANQLKHTFTNTDGSFMYPSNPFSGVGFNPTMTADACIVPITNDRLLLDLPIPSGSETIIYNIDYYNNIIVATSITNNTGRALAVNNGLVFTDPNTFYTARVGNIGLVKSVIGTNSITKTVIPLPVNETSVELVTNDLGANVLLFCTNAIDIYQYDLVSGRYIKKYALPTVFRGRTLRQQELVNGDVIVWRPINTETVKGVVIKDSVVDMLYIDNKNSTCTHITPATGVNDNITGSVLTNSGKVLLVTSAAVGYNVLSFE